MTVDHSPRPANPSTSGTDATWVHGPAALGPPEIDGPQLRSGIERTCHNLAEFLEAPAPPAAAPAVLPFPSAASRSAPSSSALRGTPVLAAATGAAAGAAFMAYWLLRRRRSAG